MELTWERVIPDSIDQTIALQREVLRQHLERYGFAQKFVSHRRVIDAACGCGYGSQMLKEAGALCVLGMDVDRETVRYANHRYGDPDIVFRVADLEDYAFDTWPFDVLVSLETLEHLKDPVSVLRRARENLPANGMIIASVPTVPTLDINEFHKHEFTPDTWRLQVERSGLCIVDELMQRYCANFTDLAADQKAPNTPRTGARRQPIRYYLCHPLRFLERITRLLRHGMEFEALTLACTCRTGQRLVPAAAPPPKKKRPKAAISLTDSLKPNASDDDRRTRPSHRAQQC